MAKIWKTRARKALEDTKMDTISKTDATSGTGDLTLYIGDHRVTINGADLQRLCNHYYADHRYAWQVEKTEFVHMHAVRNMTFGELRAEVIARRMKETED